MAHNTKHESGPTADRIVALAHATGFSAGVWDPVVAGLAPRSTHRWNFHGHGGTAAPEAPISWWTFGFQAATETRPGMIGVGHSMGGAALLMAELLDPGRFEALVLIEPIVFEKGDPELIKRLADGAERRTMRFGSRREAESRLRSRPAFAEWHPEAMAGYLRDGFVDGDGGVTLACLPSTEAAIYWASHSHGLWDRIGEVACRTVVVSGTDSDTFPAGYGGEIAGRLQHGRAEDIEGAGHLLPMEHPDEVIRLINSLG